MFRSMRRKNQQLSIEDAQKILDDGTSGVIALNGDDGYNYALPISYVRDDDKIYFHVARSGHKIDAIRRNDKVSFCVIAQDQIVPEEFTTYFKSAIAFGKIKIIDNVNDPEMRRGLELLADKYSPNVSAELREKEISGKMKALFVLVMQIEHLTGKAAREIVSK